MTPSALPLLGKRKPMSVLDMAFFMLETRERMSNVGPLAILRPPARTRSAKAFADRLMKQMKARPVGAPFNLRYRPAGLQGLPCLETVAEVDLDAHCHRVTLPAPGTDAQLFEAVCRLHEARLDRSRPPWAFYIFDGLEGGRIALYAKVHHGIIDGRGFVELCTRWFNTDPADRSARALWEGPPQRPAREAGMRSGIDVAALTARAAAAAKSAVSLYLALLRQTLASTKLSPGMPLPFVATPDALQARPSVRRTLGYCVLPLARMKAFGKAHEASVNDVLLTVLDMALNRYLLEHGRGADAPPLVVDMPVALPKKEGGSGGNSIAVLQFVYPGAAIVVEERSLDAERLCEPHQPLLGHLGEGFAVERVDELHDPEQAAGVGIADGRDQHLARVEAGAGVDLAAQREVRRDADGADRGDYRGQSRRRRSEGAR